LNLAERLAFALFAAGMAALLAASLRGRDARAGLAMLAELWMSAGLLRLTYDRTFANIAFTAVLIVVRTLLVRALRPHSRRLGRLRPRQSMSE
jgi:hypothetical protein